MERKVGLGPPSDYTFNICVHRSLCGRHGCRHESCLHHIWFAFRYKTIIQLSIKVQTFKEVEMVHTEKMCSEGWQHRQEWVPEDKNSLLKQGHCRKGFRFQPMFISFHVKLYSNRAKRGWAGKKKLPLSFSISSNLIQGTSLSKFIKLKIKWSWCYSVEVQRSYMKGKGSEE